jgi:peptidyl-dipeptidase A
MDKSFYSYIFILPLIFLLLSCQTKSSFILSQKGFQKFISDYENKVELLMTKHNQAEWDAYTTGKKEFYDASTDYSLQVDAVHQNRDHYLYLKKLLDENNISDPILKRQLDILFIEYQKKQIDPDLNKQITELASSIESVFGNFRTTVKGKMFTDNQVTQILRTEKDLQIREDVWRAQKTIGNEVAKDIIKLAKLRNRAARDLGYENYFHMAMKTSELDPEKVESIFSELYRLTQKPFMDLHNEIETVFARRYGIKKSEIRPWHYEDLFAQGAPAIFEIDLDRYYENLIIPETASLFYFSAQIPVDDILNRSDLYEREGKSQHAFSFFIDRKQDIRVLCNIVPNERWMETMLHELGHAIYDKYIDQSLPFVLKEPAHPFTTEGVAMFFGSYASNAGWMQRAMKISKSEMKKIEKVSRANLRLSKLVFAHWSMVVLNFEKNFYKDPDQNLNNLWWDLVEKYQLIKRPEDLVGSEWATKIHIATYPVYYQNYQLGELFASQILNYLAENYYGNAKIEDVIFWQKPEAGNYLKENVFKPGKRLPWSDMIIKATGEPLSAEFFVKQYVTSL